MSIGSPTQKTDPLYRYHNLSLPQPSLVAEVTHAVVAFATPETFLDAANTSSWQPFEAFDSVKKRFSPNVKVCLSIGGWGSNIGFEKGVMPANQGTYATNVASVLQRLSFDCVGMMGSPQACIVGSLVDLSILIFPSLDRHRLGISWWRRR